MQWVLLLTLIMAEIKKNNYGMYRKTNGSRTPVYFSYVWDSQKFNSSGSGFKTEMYVARNQLAVLK